jgi:3',5'-cyclic AMP phosphodiesterase CpdA
MRTIAHISDLHFGTEEPRVADGLLADLVELAPDVIANSGDLTQRARKKQFAAARDFLGRLPKPQITVPGNHDIPLFDLVRRIFRPLDRYRHYISSDLQPFFADNEIAIAGVNTARSTAWKNGVIAANQVAHLHGQFTTLPSGPMKILLAHHPFVPTPQKPGAAVVRGGFAALDVLKTVGCRLVLSGHLHHTHAWDAKTYDARRHHAILAIQAGTAISRRRRGEPNAYNVIRIDGDALRLEVRAWNGKRFAATTLTQYRVRDDAWARDG